MSIPEAITSNRKLMNKKFHQEEFIFDNLKEHHHSNRLPSTMFKKTSSTSNFSIDPDLLRELNVRYLHDINIPRTPYSRADHHHQHAHTPNLNILTPPNDSSLEKLSNSHLSPSKCNKWCSAHVRISWMIYHHQQQRLKEKSSLLDNKTDEEASLNNNKLPDLISNTKSVISSSSNNLPLSTYQTSFLSSPNFNFRSPFNIPGGSNSSFGRVPPSQISAFGGLGSLFPSTIDRKSDINGPVTALNFDWTRFARGCGPFSSTNDGLSSKKLNETNNSNESRKRSSDVLDDDRRRSHHHHYASSQFLNKTSSPVPRKHNSSDDSKTSSHLFPTFNPLTLSIIERQRLLTAYASLITPVSQTTNYFPNTFDPAIFRNQNSSTLFQNHDSSAITAALMQREYFINSLRLSQQQQIERTAVVNAQMSTTSKTKDAVSNSSTSSKRAKYIERGKESPPPSNTQNHDLTSKEESSTSH